jgi:hypothetical protein
MNVGLCRRPGARWTNLGRSNGSDSGKCSTDFERNAGEDQLLAQHAQKTNLSFGLVEGSGGIDGHIGAPEQR